jgi:hypothetical protein
VSLRRRLALLVAVAVAAAVAMVAGLAYMTARASLTAQFDETLRTQARQLATAPTIITPSGPVLIGPAAGLWRGVQRGRHDDRVAGRRAGRRDRARGRPRGAQGQHPHRAGCAAARSGSPRSTARRAVRSRCSGR